LGAEGVVVLRSFTIGVAVVFSEVLVVVVVVVLTCCLSLEL
jgi:hypothetical protein